MIPGAPSPVVRRWLEAATSALLMATMAALVALVGYLVVGGAGLAVGLLLVALLFALGSGAPPGLVLRLQGARPLSYYSAPELFHTVERLAARARIPTPQLFVIASATPNAAALGASDHGAALMVTSAALQLLDESELEGVLAHEIAHLSSGDTVTLQLVSGLSRALSSLLRFATWIALFTVMLTGGGVGRLALVALLALAVPPLWSGLFAALSRTREHAADAAAAELTGKPWALASALAKLEQRQRSWLERVFGMRPRVPEWLRSHPATAERIRRLMHQAGLAS